MGCLLDAFLTRSFSRFSITPPPQTGSSQEKQPAATAGGEDKKDKD